LNPYPDDRSDSFAGAVELRQIRTLFSFLKVVLQSQSEDLDSLLSVVLPSQNVVVEQCRSDHPDIF
jgi:hypothetical protein